MTSDQYDVAIVGGGLAGLALAYELSKRRRRKIVIIERKHVGAGGTSRNIGRVRTSQFSEPLARYAKRAFAKHAQLSTELSSNTLFWTPGYALVFYDEDEVETIDGIRKMLHAMGQKTEYYTGRKVVERLPILDGGAQPVATLIRPDACIHHDSLQNAYKRRVLAYGVEIVENTEVEAVESQNGAVQGVVTQDRSYRSPIVVNAAGGWSGDVSRLAGIQVPNTPVRREAIVTESCQPYMDTMITFYRPIEGWFHQTLRGETVIGVTDPNEPLGMNTSASPLHLRRAAEQILSKAPKLSALRVVRQWAGVYDMTPDRKPMLGFASQLKGFVQFNGDNGRGIALIPYTAELLAEWIDTDRRPEALTEFDANRYVGKEDTPVVLGDYYAAYRRSS
ncbi:FAD-binding oxidoreductase [Aminobacter sp. J44]|uniref:NAD(P)/FAD-dependent oxidoreductase n=1 Tax=Aminobacter sp. J44 TaxID=935262 RepID=UPI00119A5A20|nr:FAD-binding oxidoreductase [Aminobacter sp. J44]TWG53214.1 sarcosine oxidase subunit beta [Aminobacter sp. J44]